MGRVELWKMTRPQAQLPRIAQGGPFATGSAVGSMIDNSAGNGFTRTAQLAYYSDAFRGGCGCPWDQRTPLSASFAARPTHVHGERSESLSATLPVGSTY